jgi:hypothetical protein
VTFQEAVHGLIADPDFEAASHGLIPADRNLINLGGIADNPFMREIVEQLKHYDVLSERILEQSDLKAGVARFFWDQCLAQIIDSKYFHLFFESSSTIAYVSSEFNSRLSTMAGQKHLGDWVIRTNNILTYLLISLTRNVELQFMPYGPPEAKYGATFGPIGELTTYPAPGPLELPKAAKRALQEVQEKFSKLPENTLILATASGLDLKDQVWQGPHVGSYHNQLFKRVLLQAGRPVVLFLDETKVRLPFNPEHCFLVCEPQRPWRRICEETPLAVCVLARNSLFDQKFPSPATVIRKMKAAASG